MPFEWLLAAIVMVLAVLGTSRLLSLVEARPLLRLFVEATAGALAYGAVLYRAEPAWVREALATMGVRWNAAERVERDVASREA